MKLSSIVIALLVVTGSAHAQLIAKPHRTVDREFIADSIALAGAWTADTISTQQRWSWCDRTYGTAYSPAPDCYEGGGFFNNTRDLGRVMGAWAAVDVASAVVSYEWKKHVRNKWLHPLWRVPFVVQIEIHATAAAGNWRLPGRVQ